MSLLTDIHNTLEQDLSPNHLQVIDERGDGQHIKVEICTDLFNGLPLIKKHKLVYKSLDKFLKNDLIHAVKINITNE